MRFLVVDDSATMRRIVVNSLNRIGFADTVEAGDGQEALELFGPEIGCVIHTHTRAGVAVSAMKCGLLPISQHAMRVHAEVTYHDYEGIALYLEEQERMARDLGRTAKAMILRNHGLLALGDTVREAFEIMYYLDAACQIQVDACAGGLHNVQLMSDDAAKKSYDRLSMTDHPRAHRDWPALLRLLERKGIRYAD